MILFYLILKKVENSSAFASKISAVKPKDAIAGIAKKAVDIQDNIVKSNSDDSLKKQFTFKKPLTQREQVVLDYFVQNADKIVYAKDLAKILELPTDYVYKYIKNLRAKITEDVLQNATKGGYKLTV